MQSKTEIKHNTKFKEETVKNLEEHLIRIFRSRKDIESGAWYIYRKAIHDAKNIVLGHEAENWRYLL